MANNNNTKFIVYLRFPFPRNGFQDPEICEWSEEKEKELREYLSSVTLKQGEINWTFLANKFQVSEPFILQQAVWLYEKELEHVRGQMMRVNKSLHMKKSVSSKAPFKSSFVRSKSIDLDNPQNQNQINRSKTEGHLISDTGSHEITRPYLQEQAKDSTNKLHRRSSSFDVSPPLSPRPQSDSRLKQPQSFGSNDLTVKPTRSAKPQVTSPVPSGFDDQRRQLEDIQLKMQQQLQQQQQQINMEMQMERLKQNRPYQQQQQPSSMDELVADLPNLNLKERFDIKKFNSGNSNKRLLSSPEPDEFNDTDDDYNAFLPQ